MKGKSVMSSAFSLRLLFLIMAACVWAVSPGILAAADGDAQHLNGFWLLTFNLPPDQALGFLPTEIKQLSNFTTDGSMIATSNLPALPEDSLLFSQVLSSQGLPPFPKIKLSTGHGDWIRTGNATFRLQSWRVATCVDPAGCEIPWVGISAKLDDSVGWGTGSATVEVDQKSGTMKGTVELRLFAPDLTTPILPPAVGTLTGSRHKP